VLFSQSLFDSFRSNDELFGLFLNMRKSLHLALSLIRIPHLAISLFLFPLLISLVLVFVQLVVTGLLLKASSIETVTSQLTTKREAELSMVRRILYGSPDLRPPIRVCRWNGDPDDERPAESECSPDRLDVAINVSEPSSFDPSKYVELFNGQVDRLHVCHSCQPDVVIAVDSSGIARSEIYSVYGLVVLSLPYAKSDVRDQKIQLMRNISDIKKSFGELHLHLPDVAGGIGVSQLQGSMPFTLNIGLLVLMALWLALRAHRRVLDYFSQNNVLLPLVAACGKGRFYSALWMLTLLRVGCFLCASIPMVFFGLKDIAGPDIFRSLEVSTLQILSWLFVLVSTFGLATVIASIAELKHRHSVLSFSYKVMPILIAILGAVLWGATFIFPTDAMATLRMWLAAIPIIGMTPIFLAPIIKLPVLPLLIHGVCSVVLLKWALAHNARWFAAHLEEV
jgi:hypothetical protein